mmetsp:Transcript_3462/g.5910  ORF Transcript_3462/g.5910 Transcript_3462/m.5910 type:complete len:208 (-) Transcript_3462:399-1022(-)
MIRMITRTPVTHDFDIRPLPVLLLIVGRVRVRIPLEGLVAVLGVQLVWAQQPLAGQRGLVGFQILPPLGLIVGDIALRLSIIGIPGSTEGVVDRPWGALVRSELVVPADQEVPLHWELANEGVVLDPGEAVQKAAGGRLVQELQSASGVGGMPAVDEEAAAPVLSRIDSLLTASQLAGLCWLVVVLYTHDRVFIITMIYKLREVTEP